MADIGLCPYSYFVLYCYYINYIFEKHHSDDNGINFTN